MIASTNLVIELGVVMLVLLGWQFMFAEFVGGPLMIALVALFGGFVLARAARRGRQAPAGGTAGRRAGPRAGIRGAHRDQVDGAAAFPGGTFGCRRLRRRRRHDAAPGTGRRLRGRGVPRRPRAGRCLGGSLRFRARVLDGPRERARRAAHRRGELGCARSGTCRSRRRSGPAGISFGGVVSFIFADLIAMPPSSIYRKYYGSRLALRIVGLLYVVMVDRRSRDPGDLRAGRRDPGEADDSGAIDPVRLELHHLSRHRLPRLRRRGVVAGPQQGAVGVDATTSGSRVRHAGAGGRRAGMGVIRACALPVLFGPVPGVVPREPERFAASADRPEGMSTRKDRSRARHVGAGGDWIRARRRPDLRDEGGYRHRCPPDTRRRRLLVLWRGLCGCLRRGTRDRGSGGMTAARPGAPWK